MLCSDCTDQNVGRLLGTIEDRFPGSVQRSRVIHLTTTAIFTPVGLSAKLKFKEFNAQKG